MWRQLTPRGRLEPARHVARLDRHVARPAGDGTGQVTTARVAGAGGGEVVRRRTMAEGGGGTRL